jgi:hypothetical protein
MSVPQENMCLGCICHGLSTATAISTGGGRATIASLSSVSARSWARSSSGARANASCCAVTHDYLRRPRIDLKVDYGVDGNVVMPMFLNACTRELALMSTYPKEPRSFNLHHHAL